MQNPASKTPTHSKAPLSVRRAAWCVHENGLRLALYFSTRRKEFLGQLSAPERAKILTAEWKALPDDDELQAITDLGSRRSSVKQYFAQAKAVKNFLPGGCPLRGEDGASLIGFGSLEMLLISYPGFCEAIISARSESSFTFSPNTLKSSNDSQQDCFRKLADHINVQAEWVECKLMEMDSAEHESAAGDSAIQPDEIEAPENGIHLRMPWGNEIFISAEILDLDNVTDGPTKDLDLFEKVSQNIIDMLWENEKEKHEGPNLSEINEAMSRENEEAVDNSQIRRYVAVLKHHSIIKWSSSYGHYVAGKPLKDRSLQPRKKSRAPSRR